MNWLEWLKEGRVDDLFSIADVDTAAAVAAQEWSPNEQDRKAAWQLFTEVRTRIVTRRLHFRAGNEEAALDSIYKIFEYARDAIKSHEGCRHFATLSVFVLNEVIRPFTAKWHKRKEDGLLGNEDVRRQFREELLKIQDKLEKFMVLLGRLAEGDNFVPGSEAGREPISSKRDFGSSIKFDFIGSRHVYDHSTAGAPSPVTLDEIENTERAHLKDRRERASETTNDIDPGDDDVVGLAISGGGIRSATLAQGVLQRLGLANKLPYVDYISTVSGGGYLGSFLSTYLNSHDPKIGLRGNQLPFKRDDGGESEALRHIRNHSKYLLTGGFLTRVNVVAFGLYGIAINLVIVFTLIAFVTLIAKLTVIAKLRAATSETFPASWTWYVAIGILGVLVALLPIVQNLGRNKDVNEKWRRFRNRYERFCLWVVLGVLLVTVWNAVPVANYYVASILSGSIVETLSAPLTRVTFLKLFVEKNTQLAAALMSVAAFLGQAALGMLAMKFGKKKIVGGLLKTLFLISGPLILLIAYLLLNQMFVVGCGSGYWLLALFLVPFVYGYFIINVNFISPHRFYRNRLSEAYLIDESIRQRDQLLLSEMRQRVESPYHLINGAVNLPATNDLNLRGRDSDFFLFSQEYCGSPTTGYFRTTEFEKLDGHLDVGTAMSISAAAASPHMGTNTLRQSSFLLTLLNVRLNYWVRSPRKPTFWKRLPAWTQSPSSIYLLRELFGRIDEKEEYVNVSDGGHIENLAIYELLRRKCRFIVAIDGEADPSMQFTGLMKLLRFARIDMGINIRINLGDLRKDASGNSRAHFAMGRIVYGHSTDCPNSSSFDPAQTDSHSSSETCKPDCEFGYLLYIKSSVTGNESPEICDYRERNPSFPHQTTADQFFEEEQFEAYRALGFHMADELFRPELYPDEIKKIADQGKTGFHQWIYALAANLWET